MRSNVSCRWNCSEFYCTRMPRNAEESMRKRELSDIILISRFVSILVFQLLRYFSCPKVTATRKLRPALGLLISKVTGAATFGTLRYGIFCNKEVANLAPTRSTNSHKKPILCAYIYFYFVSLGASLCASRKYICTTTGWQNS